MKNVMGIINLAEDEQEIKELTNHRSLAVVPFGGRYRLIDFALSNLVNAGVRNVAILTMQKFRSLVDHVGSGKEWDLDRKRDGLFLIPPAYTTDGMTVSKGDIDNFYMNLDYIQKSSQDYVIISGSNLICNIDYRAVMNTHMANDADITVVYRERKVHDQECLNCTFLELDGNQQVTDIQVNPRIKPNGNVSMKVYVMKKELLMELVDGCMTRGGYDLVKDGIIKNLDRLRVYGYNFEGYVGMVDSLYNYYKHSMELLCPDVWQELFYKHGFISTKVKNEAPAKHREDALVKNSLIANGCVIEGTVENSILFRGVKVQKGAVIKNSIVMQKAQVEEDVVLDHVILDKDVTITKHKRLQGEENYPVVIRKQAVI